MKKIVIKKRYLDCITKQHENIQLSSSLPNDWNGKLKRAIDLRQEFSDIIPLDNDIKKNCEDYLVALETEDYETCAKFIIEY